MDRTEIQNLITELIEKTGISVVEISAAEESPEKTWFKVEVSEPHFYVSRDGEGLTALNHLVRRVVESKNKGGITDITIDINGFQKKRIEGVRAVAHMMAERARYFKSNIEVDPMSSFERRVVHEFLAAETDLKTESIGTGSSRRVVIKYLSGI